jgi:hypothetical protein
MNRHLGEKMVTKVEDQKHTDFTDFVGKGGRLTVK